MDITKFKVTEPDVQAALMALGRHFGMFTDKVEVTEGGSVTERIQAGRARAYAKADAEKGDTGHPVPFLVKTKAE